ncbi:hypothetical protein ACTL6U_14215 [Rhodovibrionaceae bacterium A322]
MPRLTRTPQTALLFALSLAFLLLFSPLVSAQELTAAKIEGFLDSLPQVEALGLEVDEGEGMSALPRVMQGEPFTAGVEIMRNAGQLDELQDIIARQGFSDLNDWSNTGDRIFRAAVAIEIPAQLTEMDAQLEIAKAQIMEAESLTQAQKDEMLSAFSRMRDALQNIVDQADPADISAVEPYMPRLRAAME